MTAYARADDDIEAPSYDWARALGAVPATLRPGEQRRNHPLSRALKLPATRAHALTVLRECISACEGRNQFLGVLLNVHWATAQRMVSRAGLLAYAAKMRAEHGHASESGFGCPLASEEDE